MNFVFAQLTDFRTVGCDPDGFRHSIDGTMGLCHDKWAEIFVPDLKNDTRFTVLMHGSEAFNNMILEHFTEPAEELPIEEEFQVEEEQII